MNRTILVFSLMFTAVCAFGQTPAASNHAAIEKQIVAAERAVNDAFAKGDVKAFHALVAPDAFGIDPSGIAKVSGPDFDKMMQATKVQSWNLDGSQFNWIGDNTVVHMYKWTGKGSYQGQPIPSPTWASTIWTNKAGKWLAVFHQETTAVSLPVQQDTKQTPAKK